MTNNNKVNISFDINRALDQTAGPLLDRASKTLISAWDMSFGIIDHLNEKSQLKRQYNISEFKNQLENKVNSIPNENFIEPELSKVGPALEASKYYFEEEEIRTMFANLIASSMDSRKINEVYPSFSEIIKQMSKLDAENLKIIFNSVSSRSKVCQIKIPIKDNGFRLLYTNVFIENHDNLDYKSNSSSLSNLSRLGLVEINYSTYYSYEEVYKEFEKTDLFQEVINYQKQYNQHHKFEIDAPNSFEFPEIVKGLVSVTPFGEAFCRICL
jgi:hypothetical protein|nr:MAG TPA: protein of unknown function (DUF4393) [Caudoviricetes sp.]